LLAILGEVGEQDFERYATAPIVIDRFPNFAVPTRANERHQPKKADSILNRKDRQCHGFSLLAEFGKVGCLLIAYSADGKRGRKGEWQPGRD